MESIELATEAQRPESSHSLGPLKAIGIFLAYFASQIVVAIAVAMVAALWLIAAEGGSKDDVIAGVLQLVIMPAEVLGTAVSGLQTLFLSWLCLRGPGNIGLRAIGWTRASPKAMLTATGAGLLLGAVYVFGLVPYFPPDPSIDWGPVIRAVSEGGWPRHLWLLLAVLIAPLAEELLFRGVLLTGFATRWSLTVSGTVVTLLFLLPHLPQVWGYTPGIFCITSLGVATLLVRIHSKSLGPAIALHAAYNLVIGISVYAA